MSEPSTWPPPPDVPPPLAAHDEFLSACVRNSTPKPPLSRLRLMVRLRQETRQDLRYCRPVVDDFCNRHAILTPVSGLTAWLGCLPIFIYIAAMGAMGLVAFFLGQRQDEAATRAEKLAFHSEKVHLAGVLLAIGLTSIGISFFLSFLRQKKAKADAAEAVAKFTR